MKTKLIAPCGMNCNICIAYLREKNRCPGCRIDNPDKSQYCRICIIANCDQFKLKSKKYCYQCQDYPCKRMKSLDKRYRTKYRMSMFDNLEYIKEKWYKKIC